MSQRKRLSERLRDAIQRRRTVPIFDDRAFSDPPGAPGPGATVVLPERKSPTAQYNKDSNEAMEQAKRRKQGKMKTWALWQRHMEARGYYFRSDKHGVLSVFKDGIEVGEVTIFGSGPDER